MCFVGPVDGASLFNSCKQILNEDPDLNPGYRQDPNLPAYQAGPNAFTRIDTTQNQIYGYHYSTNTPGAPGNVHPHFTLRLLQGNVATAALNNQILYSRAFYKVLHCPNGPLYLSGGTQCNSPQVANGAIKICLDRLEQAVAHYLNPTAPNAQACPLPP